MSQIIIASWIAPEEVASIARAFDDVLSDVAHAENAAVDSRIVSDADALLEQEEGTIRVVSLLPGVENLAAPWPEIEASLRDLFDALAETGDPVLIVTVFRHIADRDGDEAHARLIRIRRLNLLATELSREFGAFVIDLDRILADIGGIALGCDYRLQSAAALETVSEELALSVVANGLDAVMPFDAQERLTAAIEAKRSGIRPEAVLSPTDLVALGRGRNRQRVSINTDTVQESHVGWLIGQVIGGRIGWKEAGHRLVMAVRRRGLRESASLMLSALQHVTGHRRQAS